MVFKDHIYGLEQLHINSELDALQIARFLNLD